MAIYGSIVGACWIAFCLVWLALAIRRNTGRTSQQPRAIGVRLLLVLLVVLGVALGRRFPLSFGPFAGAAAAVGCVLCVGGLAFAVWARLALGRSWGMPMTLHEKPELVTSGPYRYVRHPIYAGMGAMAIGTTLVLPQSLAWCVAVLVYMVLSARREERDMALRFPDGYPEYKRRSRMLVPFVL